MRWGDPNYAKVTDKATRGTRHNTVIYGSNAAGEFMPHILLCCVSFMPHIYCFGSSADNSENFQVKPNWVQGIPKVRGKYGCPTTETYDSSVAVSNIGCSDE